MRRSAKLMACVGLLFVAAAGFYLWARGLDRFGPILGGNALGWLISWLILFPLLERWA